MKNFIYVLCFILSFSVLARGNREKVTYHDLNDFFKLPISDIEKSNFYKLLNKGDFKRYVFLAKEENNTFLKNALLLYFIYYNIDKGNFNKGVELVESVKNKTLREYFVYKILNSPKRDRDTFYFLYKKGFISKKNNKLIFSWILNLIGGRKFDDAKFILKYSTTLLEKEDVNYLNLYYSYKKGGKLKGKLLNCLKNIGGKYYNSYFIIFKKKFGYKSLKKYFSDAEIIKMSEFFIDNGNYYYALNLLKLIDTKNDKVFMLIGKCYFKLKNVKRALTYFLKIKNKKYFLERNFYVCRTYLKLNKIDEAANLFECNLLNSSLSTGKKISLLMGIAYNYELINDLDGEEKYYSLLVLKFGSHLNELNESYWKLAWINVFKGDLERGLRFYEKDVDLKIGDTFYLSSLFWYGYYNFLFFDKIKGRDILITIGMGLPYTYYGYLSKFILKKFKVKVSKGSISKKLLQPLFNGVLEKEDDFSDFLSENEKKFIKYLLFFKDYGYLEKYLLSLSQKLKDKKNFYYFIYLINKKCGRYNRVIYFFFKEYPDFYTYDVKEVDEKILKDIFPYQFKRLVKKFAHKNRLNPFLLLSLIRNESAFDPFAKSHSGALGLMQLMPFTAKRFARRAGIRHFRAYKLYYPYVNLAIGTKYLKYLKKKFKKLAYVVASYNGGSIRVKNTVDFFEKYFIPVQVIEQIPMRETRDYFKSIFRNFIYYNYIYKRRILKPGKAIKYFLGEFKLGGKYDFRNKKRR